jgi:prevent-host-death family protein
LLEFDGIGEPLEILNPCVYREALHPRSDRIIELTNKLVMRYNRLMRTVNVYEAKARFSELLAATAGGEEIIVAKNGKPVAKLVPYSGPVAPNRGYGSARGVLHVPPDFDDPLPPEVLDLFE